MYSHMRVCVCVYITSSEYQALGLPAQSLCKAGLTVSSSQERRGGGLLT